ncbi:MAG: ribose 5-phosphate isomerase B [Rhodothermales bacterium]|nr:ribose 5-phosphate isomerase B [Rhodothermales bacterium]
MAKRPLITEKHVREALAAGRATLEAPADALITALARDTAREHGLAFVAPAPEASASAPAAAPRPHVVALGSDHGGYGYKQLLKPFLEELGWQVLDLGTDSEASCDYPDFAFAVARAVALGRAGYGIMIDGAGIGSAMVAGKVAGIRAACCYNEFTAWNARAHNDATVLTLGSRTLGIEVCKRIAEVFLATSFEGGRHARRVQKIMDVEARFLPGGDA